MGSELWRRDDQGAADRWQNGPSGQAGSWARGVEAASERWAGSETEVSVDGWRAAMVAKAAQPGGIGSPEWHRACRAASRRAWRRHPLRSARAALRWRVIKWLDTDA